MHQVSKPNGGGDGELRGSRICDKMGTEICSESNTGPKRERRRDVGGTSEKGNGGGTDVDKITSCSDVEMMASQPIATDRGRSRLDVS